MSRRGQKKTLTAPDPLIPAYFFKLLVCNWPRSQRIAARGAEGKGTPGEGPAKSGRRLRKRRGSESLALKKSIICRSRASRDRAAVRTQERNAEGKEAGTGSEAHRSWGGGGEGGTQRSLMGWGRSPPVTGPARRVGRARGLDGLLLLLVSC